MNKWKYEQSSVKSLSRVIKQNWIHDTKRSTSAVALYWGAGDLCSEQGHNVGIVLEVRRPWHSSGVMMKPRRQAADGRRMPTDGWTEDSQSARYLNIEIFRWYGIKVCHNVFYDKFLKRGSFGVWSRFPFVCTLNSPCLLQSLDVRWHPVCTLLCLARLDAINLVWDFINLVPEVENDTDQIWSELFLIDEL